LAAISFLVSLLHYQPSQHGKKGFVIPTKSFVKIGTTKIFFTSKCLVLSTKRLVAAAKFLVAATNILFVVPNFVAVTKPFFFSVSVPNFSQVQPRHKNNIFVKLSFFLSYAKFYRVTECFNGYFNLELILA